MAHSQDFRFPQNIRTNLGYRVSKKKLSESWDPDQFSQDLVRKQSVVSGQESGF